MSYVVYVAVERGQLDALVSKVKAINGETPRKQEEQLKASIFKDYSTGMSQADFGVFLEWLLVSSPGVCGTREKIMIKMKALKLERFATLHVQCPDGKIPENLSMFFLTPNRG